MLETFTINWPYLLVALALLWMPRQWLRTGKRVLKRRRKPDGALEQLAGVGARSVDDRSVHPGKEFKTFRNYVDFFRGLTGALALKWFGLISNGPDGDAWVFWLITFVLVVGTMIQSVRYDRRLSFFAAIFYLAGVSTAFMHYSSLFAFALVVALNPGIPNARLFITAYGFALLIFGLIFSDDWAMLGVNVALFLSVPLISLMMKRPVVIFSRKSRRASA